MPLPTTYCGDDDLVCGQFQLKNLNNIPLFQFVQITRFRGTSNNHNAGVEKDEALTK
jgi:hypothetical protein